jgi:CheY-like chemotaxis protein
VWLSVPQNSHLNDTMEMMPGQTVLVVDDHPSFRATARAMLEVEGYTVVGEAEDGASAVHAVEELRPDIVLLDIQLPDMDGFEVVTRLQALNGARPKIVLTSSRDGSDFGTLVEESAAVGFVPKSELCGGTLGALLG